MPVPVCRPEGIRHTVGGWHWRILPPENGDGANAANGNKHPQPSLLRLISRAWPNLSDWK